MKKTILIVLSALFLISFYFLKPYLSVFYFQNDKNRVAINIETKTNIGKTYICFDKDCDEINNENNIYSYKLNQENPRFYKNYRSAELIFEKNYKDIKQIDIFNGNNLEIIKNFKADEVDFLNKKMHKINLGKINNSKNILQDIGVYFEGIIHNWYFYLILFSIILLFKPKINLENKLILPAIILLGFLLRLSHIDFIPLWNDELYTFSVISDCGKTFALKNIFLDPGNPPLFFLISNIWLKFFHNSVFSIRLLPLALGTILIFISYNLANKIFNKKIALTCAFLISINLLAIAQSNEIRSYILAMNLILFSSYYFYKLIENFNNKNLFYYLLSIILLINTHFYCTLFALFNCILGIYIFKNKAKFIILNLFSFLTFGIYYFISYKRSIFSDFNSWIPKISNETFLNHITFYFGNIFLFFLSIIFIAFIFKKLKKIEQKAIIYFVSSISFVFIFALCFSIFIKPILFERYFCIFLPFLIIITSILLNYDYKTKCKPLLIGLILFLSINMPKYENFNLFSNIYENMIYSIKDYESYKKDYEVFFVIPDNIKYANYYKDFKNIERKNLIVSNYGTTENIDTIDISLNKKRGKFIFYIPEICTNQTIIKKYNPQKLNTSILPIYKFFVVK